MPGDTQGQSDKLLKAKTEVRQEFQMSLINILDGVDEVMWKVTRTPKGI